VDEQEEIQGLDQVRKRKSGAPIVVRNSYEDTVCRQCSEAIPVGACCWWGAGFGEVCMSCAEKNTRRLKELKEEGFR
jgi:hypothetical protein